MRCHLSNLAFLATASLTLAASALANDPLVAAKGAPFINNFKIDRAPVDHAQTIRVALSLSGFNQAAADAFIQSQQDPTSPNFHHWIKTSEFGRRFGANDYDVQLVSRYLTSNGFSDIRVAAGKSYISAKGTFALGGEGVPHDPNPFCPSSRSGREGRAYEFLRPLITGVVAA